MVLFFIVNDFHPPIIIAFNHKGSVWRDFFTCHDVFLVRGGIAGIINEVTVDFVKLLISKQFIFLGNGLVDYIVTLVGVVVFTLYTVYDVNKIVKMSRMRTGISTSTLAFYGAIELYLDFINLFLKLLRLFGKRK